MFSPLDLFARKRKGNPIPPTNYVAPAASFRFAAPSQPPATVNSWGTWLKAQPAPVFKPGHRLQRLSTYLYGFSQEYNLALDMAERWGYGLNVGYGKNIDAVVIDAALANPNLNDGKLLKLAIQDPVRYPVAASVGQRFPEAADVPDGYPKNSSGQVYRTREWSPEAPPAAVQAAIDYKLYGLKKIVEAGARVLPIQDGGEEGIPVPAEAPGAYTNDPVIMAAKGSMSWVDYISLRKGQLHKKIFDAVKALVPNRESYIYYPSWANPFANIPDINLSTWSYQDIITISDVPAGSVYFRDVATTQNGMGNPAIRQNAYYDQLTHWLAAVGEQIASSRPLSYSYVSAGYGRGENPIVFENRYFLPIKSYKGFLKCLYASGNVGAVAAYFSPDCTHDNPQYTPYNPAAIPSWLEQQMALGEVHARMSWFDEYILDGDLLPGVGSSVVKSYTPPYELPCYRRIGSLYAQETGVRTLVRKLRSANKWLVVTWAYEQVAPDNISVVDGAPKNVYIRDIPGVETMEFLARPEGSIYTIDKSSGSTVVTYHDPE